MEIGDRFIFQPKDYVNGGIDKDHFYCGKWATVIGFDTLDRVIVAFDDFPNCNGRQQKNRFWVNREELAKEWQIDYTQIFRRNP